MHDAYIRVGMAQFLDLLVGLALGNNAC